MIHFFLCMHLNIATYFENLHSFNKSRLAPKNYFFENKHSFNFLENNNKMCNFHLLNFQMTSVAEKKYSLPSEDKKAQYLLGKILADGLSQNELNAAYDDVSKDYDQVQERNVFFRDEINLNREKQKLKSIKNSSSEILKKIILLDNKQVISRK